MRSIIVRQLPLLSAALFAAGAASPAFAQLVPIRSIPVAVADQHAIQPTTRGGVGGLSVALDDALLDPFRNPAAGARITGSRLFGAPWYYSIGDGNGNGKTLPVGGLFSGGRWFGTTMLAFQELRGAPTWGACCFIGHADVTSSTVVPSQPGDPETNLYGSATVGRRLTDGRTAIGFGASYARLRAMEGAALLYPTSSAIRQHGDALDLRLGLSRDFAGDRRLDAVVLHNRVDITHDLRFVLPSWSTPWYPAFEIHDYTRRERTDTWGAQVGFTTPMPEPGWRAGVSVTANHLRHDPRMPATQGSAASGSGESWAYSFGVGSSREDGPVTFGVEAAYEPIWSTVDGITSEIYAFGPAGTGVLIAPASAVSNHFRFHNSHLRIGAGYDLRRLGFQLGTQLRTVRYDLEQRHVGGSGLRERSESWTEWKPTWGLSARFPEIEIRYDGSYQTGTGRPNVGYEPGQTAGFAPVILVAPSHPLQVQEARVLSHRVSVAVPIGRARTP